MRSVIRALEALQRVTENTEDALSAQKMFDQYDSWIKQLFGSEAPGVIARLEDVNDSLDIVHINQLTQSLMTLASGADPTG
jgi:hypothetical protein